MKLEEEGVFHIDSLISAMDLAIRCIIYVYCDAVHWIWT